MANQVSDDCCKLTQIEGGLRPPFIARKGAFVLDAYINAEEALTSGHNAGLQLNLVAQCIIYIGSIHSGNFLAVDAVICEIGIQSISGNFVSVSSGATPTPSVSVGYALSLNGSAASQFKVIVDAALGIGNGGSRSNFVVLIGINCNLGYTLVALQQISLVDQ